MKSKVHLKSSSEPISDGADQLVACGLLLKKAKAVAMIDATMLPETEWGDVWEDVSQVNRECQKCLINVDEGRYVYMLVSSQEAFDAERGQ